MTPEQRIARALYEIERQRTNGEWNLCKVRDLLTGEEPAALRDQPFTVEERVMCEAEPQVWLVSPQGALYTPPTNNTGVTSHQSGGATCMVCLTAAP